MMMNSFYRYECDCGLKHTVALNDLKEFLVLTCERCGRGVTARRVADKNVKLEEKDGLIGVFRRDKKEGKNGDTSTT
jgi:predicted nucleic acid-binding Zn ribbon protein